MAKKSKKESSDEAIAEAVGAGRELCLETVDFSDPNRPKTCLEVDFPILPINRLASIEGKGSGALKPVYQTMKWWARRRSTVFRQLLLAAAAKAPGGELNAAKHVWDAYYANHQKNTAFLKIKVADIFMGGGTTLVEGARLGMQMFGNDLNPVAWFVVKNELAQVDPKEVKRLLDHIESEVKPQIMPYYACDCPRGHKGKWTKKSTGRAMGDKFDPLALKPEERSDHEYKGPEVIYTFWAKHGPCQTTECNHRTPIMTTPVVATRTIAAKAWINWECTKCGGRFDIEREDTRIAPSAMFVIAATEAPYVTMTEDGKYECPSCGQKYQDVAAATNGRSATLSKPRNKNIELTVLVHPEWLRGSPGYAGNGQVFGGSVQDSAESTAAWNQERHRTLKLIEVRGALPEQIACPDTGEVLFTDHRGGTVPKRSTFTCKEATCGLDQDVLGSIKASTRSGPMAMYAVQCYCPQCEKDGRPNSGRFFDLPNADAYDAANREWEAIRYADLSSFWPQSELPYGFMTHHLNGGIPNHGFTHWWTMFNPRQLLVHARLLRAIVGAAAVSWDAKEAVLGVFQQYLRNQNMFCFWNSQRALEPMFSNNNFHPKSTVIENSVFSGQARGDFRASSDKLLEAMEWRSEPWEIACDGDGGHSDKVPTNDPVIGLPVLTCRSASDLKALGDHSIDLIITDPPFGGLLHYSELSDLFYVWLRLPLKDRYPDIFGPEYSPKALEAVSNVARHPDDADRFYQKLLTECWREARRTLKPGGLLAFTFHHSEDEPWVAVLESLFDAGFYLEATYPIRGDETKGDGEFGSRKIEYDIIHVCRKRTEEPQPLSWARMRRQIMQDVRQLQDILGQHEAAGLQPADLQVIRRGKALEYYSKHYGKVYVEKGREFTVREALVGIHQLLDDVQDTGSEMPPVVAEAYTRQFLRLFSDRTSLARDQMQKYLRGTGVSPAEFADRGWCSETSKVFHLTPPLELAKNWKGMPRNGMARDFDQSMFLVGACYEKSGIRVQDTLDSPKFVPHPATGDILDWLTRHGGDSEIKDAAKTAKQLYNSWLAKNKGKVEVQRSLFDLEGDEV